MNSYLSKQWAAVKMCLTDITDPPQKYVFIGITNIAAIQGYLCGNVSVPFTILRVLEFAFPHSVTILKREHFQ